jgi:hypothetical protein
VKRQVDGAKELSKALGLGPFIGHQTRVAAGTSIVNPDGLRRVPRSTALSVADQ